MVYMFYIIICIPTQEMYASDLIQIFLEVKSVIFPLIYKRLRVHYRTKKRKNSSYYYIIKALRKRSIIIIKYCTLEIKCC